MFQDNLPHVFTIILRSDEYSYQLITNILALDLLFKGPSVIYGNLLFLRQPWNRFKKFENSREHIIRFVGPWLG